MGATVTEAEVASPVAPMQNPARPFRNVAAYVRSMSRDPDQATYAEELEIIAKKLDEADDVFFSLGEMMIACRTMGTLEAHPQFMKAFDRARSAYSAARGEKALADQRRVESGR